MRPVLATVAVALLVSTCAAPAAEPVPLTTDPTVEGWSGCVLLHMVVDVVASPAGGTPVDKATGAPFTWPRGSTARRVGSEVEVVRDGWQVVLTTGRRYWICPDTMAFFRPTGTGTWVIGDVRECPDCPLGTQVD